MRNALARLARRFLSAQFVKFLIAGGLAALLNWSARFLFSTWFSYGWAVLLAYLIGLSSGYVLNAWLVFPKSGQTRRREIAYFVGVNLMSLPLVWGLSVGLGDFLFPTIMDRSLAQALGNGIGILSPVALSFVLHRKLTFRPKNS